MRSPSVASRSRTRGWRTATGPIPVMTARSGRWPWRTTRCWPVAVFRSACFARNSATSASMAWVSSARAPLRRISVRESLKAPGWASLITLLSDTAYHSFIGEVEALNTTTIRRLTPSCRHQLLAIARLVIHAAHASHATARRHSSCALRFRPVGYHRLGGDQQSRDRAGILQRYPHHFGRIDNPGLHHVLVLARLCVKAEIRVVLVGQLADHDRALDPGILGDLTYRRLYGLADDLDADLLVVVRGV